MAAAPHQIVHPFGGSLGVGFLSECRNGDGERKESRACPTIESPAHHAPKVNIAPVEPMNNRSGAMSRIASTKFSPLQCIGTTISGLRSTISLTTCLV